MSETATKPFVKGFKYPIYPTDEQKLLFEKTFGCARYVYNRCLAEAKQEYEAYQLNPELPKPRMSGYDFVNKLPAFKKDPESLWLNEVSAVALQQSVTHLGQAFTRFFKTKKGYPAFKKKQSAQSFTLVGTAFWFKDGHFWTIKSGGPVATDFHRPLPSSPTSATISRTASGKYYVSFVCQYTPAKTTGTKITGIDLGIKTLATLSDGTKIDNPKHYLRYQKQLKRKQQSLARKQKGSKNRNKARIAVAKQHERTSNSLNDLLHKLSRTLVNENQVIGIETLKVANMIKNRKLSRHIAGVAWSKLLHMLMYKAIESQHCYIVKVDTFYPSSHLCNITGLHLGRKLKLSEREWLCPHCGEMHDRDVNAAKNIAQEAMEKLLSTNDLKPEHRVIL